MATATGGRRSMPSGAMGETARTGTVRNLARPHSRARWEADRRSSPVPGRAKRSRRRGRATPNASVLLSRGQSFAVLLFLSSAAAGACYRPRLTVTVLVAACMAFYVVTTLLKLVITLAGRDYRPPRGIRVWPGDPTLP